MQSEFHFFIKISAFAHKSYVNFVQEFFLLSLTNVKKCDNIILRGISKWAR